jgi:hypothetical protein
MASPAPESDPASYFGFKDLHGFKDFVGYVFLCAPDEFPYKDWREAEEQMTLDRAFAGLRYGLDVTASEKGETEVVTMCRELVDEAYANFNTGQDSEGRRKLNEVRGLLKKVPSQ